MNMSGDISRDSFDRKRLRHYSRVLQQQGRVELDADGNEREAIQLHHLRSLAKDLIGPQGGPLTDLGFQIDIASDETTGKALPQDFVIRKGHYYVDGWLCENDVDVYYARDKVRPSQPWLPQPVELEKGKTYLAYLDVWERHVCAAEVDDGMDITSPYALREVALGGPDTTTRAQVVWQVKVSLGPDVPALPAANKGEWAKWIKDESNWAAWRAMWQPNSRGQLKAKAADTTDADASNPCVVSPQSRYRGLENQLYRIEIHRGGVVGVVGDKAPPTFVWSRENGSVVFAVERLSDRSVKLVDGWRDARFGLAAGDVVEISDEDTVLSGAAGSLVRVTGVDLDTLTISFEAGSLTSLVDASRHAVLRRWDHGHRKTATAPGKAANEGRPIIANDLALTVTEGGWLTIEDGISVFFEAAKLDQQHYRTGDYWLIPARTAIGDVLWPRSPRSASGNHDPLSQPPHGVEHHYAPMAIVTVDSAGGVTVFTEPAIRFKSLVELTNP
jgi:hypothetical protein